MISMIQNQQLNGLFELIGAVGLFTIGLTLSPNVTALTGTVSLLIGFALYAGGLYSRATYKALNSGPKFLSISAILVSGFTLLGFGIGLGYLTALGRINPLVPIIAIPISAKLFKDTITVLEEMERKGELRYYPQQA